MTFDGGDPGGAYVKKHDFTLDDDDRLLVERRTGVLTADGLRHELDVCRDPGIAAFSNSPTMTPSITACPRLATRSPRAGTLLCVQSIGCDLPLGHHVSALSQGGDWRRRQHLLCRWDLTFEGDLLFACCERVFLELHIDDLVSDLANAVAEAMSVLIKQLERIAQFLVYGREETLDPFIFLNPHGE